MIFFRLLGPVLQKRIKSFSMHIPNIKKRLITIAVLKTFPYHSPYHPSKSIDQKEKKHSSVSFQTSPQKKMPSVKCLTILLLLAVLSLSWATSQEAEDFEAFPEYDNIDWEKVVPVEDLPGFWDDKDPILVPEKHKKEL